MFRLCWEEMRAPRRTTSPPSCPRVRACWLVSWLTAWTSDTPPPPRARRLGLRQPALPSLLPRTSAAVQPLDARCPLSCITWRWHGAGSRFLSQL